MQIQNEETDAPLPVVRSAVGGVLMGLANLVPGISGGTMILAIGLYDRFISSLADVTRLRITRRNVLFLGIVGGAAVMAIGAFAGTLREMVTQHRTPMYSLFIGLTLGGVPLLLRMIKAMTAPVVIGMVVGLGLMIAIALTTQEPPDKTALKDAVSSGEFAVEANYVRDVSAGALGMSAMVMPGISGAYMLLILDRYEPILASIDLAKKYVTSLGKTGDPLVFLRVMVPVGIGALGGLIVLSNFLKWMLRHHEKPMLGTLLGLLLGSVVGIWPFQGAVPAADYLFGLLIAAVGFVATFLISRVSA